MTMLKYAITWYFIKFGRGCTMFQPAMYSQQCSNGKYKWLCAEFEITPGEAYLSNICHVM